MASDDLVPTRKSRRAVGSQSGEIQRNHGVTVARLVRIAAWAMAAKPIRKHPWIPDFHLCDASTQSFDPAGAFVTQNHGDRQTIAVSKVGMANACGDHPDQ